MLEVARAIVDEAQSSGSFLFVETDIKIDRVEAEFEIDKERLADRMNMATFGANESHGVACLCNTL